MREAWTGLAVVLVPQFGMAMLHAALPLLAPVITAAAGVPPEAVGILAGATGLGSMWLLTSSHAVVPVLGPLRSLQAAAVVSAVAAGFVLSGIWPLVLVGALLIGFAYVVVTPAGNQILSGSTPRQHWGLLFSIRQAAVPLGGVIAGTLGAVIAERTGWRSAILLFAVLGLVFGLALSLAPARFHGGANGRRFAVSGLFAPANIVRPFRVVFSDAGLTRITLAAIGLGVVHGTMASFLTTYLTSELKLSLPLAGSIAATQLGASIPGRILCGWIADRLGSISLTLIGLAVLSATAILLVSRTGPGTSPATLFALAAFAGVAISTWNGLAIAEVAAIAPPEKVGEASASSTYFVFVTYMAVPPLFALLVATVGYRTAFSLAALPALAAGLMLTAGLVRGRSGGGPRGG